MESKKINDLNIKIFADGADISQIKKVADNKLSMPPKSTYIEPKLRSGLIIYEIE